MQRFIPDKFKTYFWDYDITELDSKIHVEFVTERLIEKGNWDTANWLLENVPEGTILDVANTSSNISDQMANFWKSLLAE